MKTWYKKIKSPLGELTLVATENAIAAILWNNQKWEDPSVEKKDHPILMDCEAQLNEYFSGKRTAFSLPLEPVGTEFQMKVWNRLNKIPFGETKSYGEIARELGNPMAMRAVGAANGRNPIAIVIPCHRVLGADGALTGFAGGIKKKDFLLKHEHLSPN